MASYVANEKSHACVLIFPKDKLFIGGSSPSIGHEGEIKTEFIWAAPAQVEAHAGISLTFPILQSDGVVAIRSRSAGQIRNVVTIKLRFFADQLDLQTKEYGELPSEYRQYVPDKHQKDTAWTAIKITGRPAIDGYPLPFAADEQYTGILHRGRPIKGSISLNSLCYGTTEFICPVKVGNWSKKVSSILEIVKQHKFSYDPFSNRLDWNVERFTKEWDEAAGQGLLSDQHIEMFSHSRFRNVSTSLVHSVAGDIVHLIRQVEDMRDIPIKVRYVRLNRDEDQPGQLLYAVILLSYEFRAEYGQALRRTAQLGDSVGIALQPKPKPMEPKDPMPDDVNYWPGTVVNPSFSELNHTGNFVLLVQRPEATKVAGAAYAKETAFLKIDPNLLTYKRLVDAVHRLSSWDRLKNELESDIAYAPADVLNIPLPDPDRVQSEQPENAEGAITSEQSLTQTLVMERLEFEQELQQQFIQGNGLRGLVFGPRRHTPAQPLSSASSPRTGAPLFTDQLFASTVQNFYKDCVSNPIKPLAPREHGTIPAIDFLSTRDERFCELVLSRLRPVARQRLEKYLKAVPLGILMVTGFPGAGKTDVISTLVNILLDHDDFDKVFVYASSNGATSNVCSRIDKLNRQFVDEYNKSLPSHRHRQYAVVIRGHNIQMEHERILSTVNDAFNCTAHHNSQQPPRSKRVFQMPLSVAEWVLKIVGFGNYRLNTDDSGELHDLRLQYLALPAYDPLRRFFADGKSWDDIVTEWETTYPDPNDADLMRKPDNLLRNLMTSLISRADVLATTPHVAKDNAYICFTRQIAKASVLDEAGAMNVPQALLGWPNFRAWLLAGDERQLPPTVMTLHEKDSSGNFVNKFARHLRVSALERFRRIGWPTCVLNEQLRIVDGGFDPAFEVIYPDMSDFTYADSCGIANRPKACQSKSKQHKGKIQPVFIHVQGQCKVEELTASRYNIQQADKTIQFILELINASNGTIESEDIGIISPYAAMNRRLESLLEGEPSLDGKVTVHTPDTFRGREKPFIFYVLTVERESTAGHVASRQRSAVGITRHTDGLFIIGDIETVKPGDAKKKTVAVTNDDGEVEMIDLGPFSRLLQWFTREKRVGLPYDDGWQQDKPVQKR
ncbi:DNA helicase [Colletotrichum asianum]